VPHALVLRVEDSAILGPACGPPESGPHIMKGRVTLLLRATLKGRQGDTRRAAREPGKGIA